MASICRACRKEINDIFYNVLFPKEGNEFQFLHVKCWEAVKGIFEPILDLVRTASPLNYKNFDSIYPTAINVES